jgi:hypothetical protein
MLIQLQRNTLIKIIEYTQLSTHANSAGQKIYTKLTAQLQIKYSTSTQLSEISK